MLETIKNILSLIKSKFLTLVNLAPFFCGIVVGYIFRTPIKWLISLIAELIRL